MKRNNLARVAAIFCAAAVFGIGPWASTALATNTVSLASDTTVYLSGSGITLVLASGSSLVSYSAGATTLTLNLDVGSSVTIKSTNLYTLTNSQTLPTLCSGTSYSYVLFTAASPTTVTLTPSGTIACTNSGGWGGGGGGGGAIITAPTISSFLASPAGITPGQSSTLSWSVNNASTLTITPAVSATSLHPLSGTATVTPASTIIYTLTAINSYSQSVTATTTVTVSSAAANPQTPPITPLPGPSGSPAVLSGTPAYCLVNHAGTLYLILSGVRHGIAIPGLLYSYGYAFPDATTDTAMYQALPSGSLLEPNDGALVKAPGQATVFLVSDGARHGFTSAKVFTGLGYKFSSVLTIPAVQLNTLQEESLVSSSTSRHLPGADVSSKGTIYYVSDSGRSPYPSLSVFNSWHLHSDFSRVLPANAADLSLPIGSIVTARTSCQ